MKNQNFPELPTEGFIRCDHFRHLLGGISRSTFFDAVRSGRLPRPVKLTARASGWQVNEVRQALAKIAAGEGQEP